MNVYQAATPASTAAPTLTEATCVAVLEVSTEPDRGEGAPAKYLIQAASSSQVTSGVTKPSCFSFQSLYDRFRFLRPVYRG